MGANSAGESAASERPVLRVVSGSPTPEELAIVTALALAAGSDSAADAEPAARRGAWSDPSWSHRGQWLTGPGAWRNALR